MKKEDIQRTRKFLNSYRFLKKEIEGRQIEMKDFLDSLYNPLKSPNMTGMPHGCGTSDSTYSQVLYLEKNYKNYQRMVEEKEYCIAMLENQIKQIEKILDQLDPDERCVCYYRFVIGVYWKDLPRYINYEQAPCARIERRALKKAFLLLPKKDDKQ